MAIETFNCVSNMYSRVLVRRYYNDNDEDEMTNIMIIIILIITMITIRSTTTVKFVKMLNMKRHRRRKSQSGPIKTVVKISLDVFKTSRTVAQQTAM